MKKAAAAIVVMAAMPSATSPPYAPSAIGQTAVEWTTPGLLLSGGQGLATATPRLAATSPGPLQMVPLPPSVLGLTATATGGNVLSARLSTLGLGVETATERPPGLGSPVATAASQLAMERPSGLGLPAAAAAGQSAMLGRAAKAVDGLTAMEQPTRPGQAAEAAAGHMSTERSSGHGLAAAADA
nr:uncharacterized protein LOC117842833 [Setaria viridis]